MHPGKGITKDMGINLRSTHISMPQQRLHRTDMQMVPHDVAFIVGTQPQGREQPLPLKRSRRIKAFTPERLGQARVALVKRILLAPGTLDARSAFTQRLNQRCGQQRRAVLVPFAAAHRDDLAVEVDVFDTQPTGLDNTPSMPG